MKNKQNETKQENSLWGLCGDWRWEEGIALAWLSLQVGTWGSDCQGTCLPVQRPLSQATSPQLSTLGPISLLESRLTL